MWILGGKKGKVKKALMFATQDVSSGFRLFALALRLPLHHLQFDQYYVIVEVGESGSRGVGERGVGGPGIVRYVSSGADAAYSLPSACQSVSHPSIVKCLFIGVNGENGGG